MKRRNLLRSIFAAPLAFLFPKLARPAKPPAFECLVPKTDTSDIAWTSLKNYREGTYSFQSEMPKTLEQVEELLRGHELSLQPLLQGMVEKMSDEDLIQSAKRKPVELLKSDSLLVAGTVAKEGRKRGIGPWGPGGIFSPGI